MVQAACLCGRELPDGSGVASYQYLHWELHRHIHTTQVSLRLSEFSSLILVQGNTIILESYDSS
jgi:hypothetical protein